MEFISSYQKTNNELSLIQKQNKCSNCHKEELLEHTQVVET